jgi:ribosomal-protein-alanine N-acetyltransferase
LIQILQKENAEEIELLEKINFNNSAWNQSQIQSHLTDFSGIGFFISRDEKNHQLISYILYIENKWEIEIFRISTHPNFQNKQYGSQILNHLLNSKPSKTFFLEVDATNHSAIHLYEKFDFHMLDKRKAYYENGNDAILFKRTGNTI